MIDSYNSWAAAAPTNASNWLLTSDYYLTDVLGAPGNSSMPNPTGGSMVGNAGNGYARITPLILKY